MEFGVLLVCSSILFSLHQAAHYSSTALLTSYCKSNHLIKGVRPNPYDCNSYIECDDYKTVIRKCHPSAWLSGVCTIYDTGKCFTKSMSIPCNRIVCFYSTWDALGRNRNKMRPHYDMGRLCTHIIFYPHVGNFVQMWYLKKPVQTLLREMVSLKKKSPNLKIILRIGGKRYGSYAFTLIATSQTLRHKFINGVLDLLKEYDLDGIDLAWMYPGSKYNRWAGRKQFSSLIKDLRKTFDKQNKNYILSATVSSQPKSYRYDVKVLNENVDFVIVLAYDFFGSWNLYHAVTHYHSDLTGPSGRSSVSISVKMWRTKGLSSKKIVIGVALYATTFTVNRRGRVVGPGHRNNNNNREKQSAGKKTYYEICLDKKNKTEPLIEQNTNVAMSREFYRKGDQLVFYSGERSVKAKARYVIDEGLGGLMVKDVGDDDFSGKFCDNGKFPLLTSINVVCH